MNSAPIQFRNDSLCPVLLNFNPNKFLTKRIEYLNSHFSRLLHIRIPTHCPSWVVDKNGSDHLMKMSDNPACPLRKRLRLLLLSLIPKNRMTLLFIVATITVPMTIWQRLSVPSRKEGAAKGTQGLCFYHFCGGAWKSKHAILHVVIWFADNFTV